ncbi:hypothetical protein L6452_05534 [Arctium lappa]|uniref:Uncharacterized protein n=1 Tax=Arctium lappa TaxID=4217 RepID=A0ACB9EG33_ARCLA|nr:hypothetical protein L6452_05534 [Arctium lappa]
MQYLADTAYYYSSSSSSSSYILCFSIPSTFFSPIIKTKINNNDCSPRKKQPLRSAQWQYGLLAYAAYWFQRHCTPGFPTQLLKATSNAAYVASVESHSLARIDRRTKSKA